MMTPQTIAAAVWTATTRTLASGTPAPPVTFLDQIVQAVWTHIPRTLFFPPTTGVSHFVSFGSIDDPTWAAKGHVAFGQEAA
jgi:hypothetical protein